jgi:hypothetical protein
MKVAQQLEKPPYASKQIVATAGRVPWHTQIFAEQLALFQPGGGGGQIMPT